jgi:glycosyltransferase involved in cell wall biosynthesis
VSTPPATIVVTTKNRREELERLLPTLFAQSVACEVLVVDDGSTDGTAEMVRAQFPEARLERSERSLGLIVQRTRAAKLATAPVIVSVDDDAVLPSTRTVEQTLADFDHPRIGAVAIPFDDVRPYGELALQRPADGAGRWLSAAYVGTAHAVRREVFLAVGGYRASLMQQVEELDYCLRMLATGYVTRIGRADPLRHLESPKRDRSRVITQTVRNELLHGWHNVPMPYLPVRWAKVTVASVALGARARMPGPAARGLWRGFRDSLRLRADRDPVPRSVYLVDHDIRKRGPLRLEDVESRLPEPGV